MKEQNALQHQREGIYQSIIESIRSLPPGDYVQTFILRQFSESNSIVQQVTKRIFEVVKDSDNEPDLVNLYDKEFNFIKQESFKKILAEVNESLFEITHSDEYKYMLIDKANYITIFERYLAIKDKTDRGLYAEVEAESTQLIDELMQLEEYDLLLSFYNLLVPHITAEKDIKKRAAMLEQYSAVADQAQLTHEHVILNIQTLQTTELAASGKSIQSKLTQLYDNLCKLMIKHTSAKLKHETLINILEVCQHMERRTHYIEPYVDYLAKNIEELRTFMPTRAHQMFHALALFSYGKDKHVRLGYIDNAISYVADDASPHEEMYYHVVKGQIYADFLDTENALREFDMADHIGAINKHRKEDFLIATTHSMISRLVVMLYENFNDRQTERGEFDNMLRLIEENATHLKDLNAISNELNGLVALLFDKQLEARKLIKKSVRYREKHSHPFFTDITVSLLELMRKNPSWDWAAGKIEELHDRNETFYSSMWYGIMKKVLSHLQAAK